MNSTEVEELRRMGGSQEDRERDGRVRRLLIILLLLLLLLFGIIFAFLSLYGGLFDGEEGEGIDMLFSVFGFDRPLSVSTDKDGQIYVSDTGNARLVVFDSLGRHIRTIQSTKRLERFYGVTGSYLDDKTGRLYVTDFRRRAITVYNRKGKRVDRWPDVPGAPPYNPLGFSPFDVTMYKNKLYVTSNNGVFVFSKKGKLLKQWNEKGKEIGQFDYPVAIDIDDKGTMYIADQLNRRVVAMTQKGVVKWTLGQPDQAGKSSSFFGLPRGLALNDKGQLFISDTFHHELVVLTTDGKLVGTVGDRGVEDARLNFPEEIVFRPDGALYITDRENHRIQTWRINSIRKPDKELRDRYKKYFIKAKG